MPGARGQRPPPPRAACSHQLPRGGGSRLGGTSTRSGARLEEDVCVPGVGGVPEVRQRPVPEPRCQDSSATPHPRGQVSPGWTGPPCSLDSGGMGLWSRARARGEGRGWWDGGKFLGSLRGSPSSADTHLGVLPAGIAQSVLALPHRAPSVQVGNCSEHHGERHRAGAASPRRTFGDRGHGQHRRPQARWLVPPHRHPFQPRSS